MDEALRALALTSHNASVMLCQLRHDEVMTDRRQEPVWLLLRGGEDSGDADQGGDEDHVHTHWNVRSHNPLLDL